MSFFDSYGSLSPEDRTRTARLPADGELLYSEEVLIAIGEDGTLEDTYIVRASPNGSQNEILDASPDWSEQPVITPELSLQLADALPGDTLRVSLKLGSFDSWASVPPPPEPTALSLGEFEDARLGRASALDLRKGSFAVAVGGLAPALQDAGVEIVASHWVAGWLTVDAPISAVLDLVGLPDVVRIAPDDVDYEEASFIVGQTRNRSNADLKGYWDNGYYGQRSGGTPLRVAVQEQWHMNDAVCALSEGATCNADRISGRFSCSSSSCQSQSAAAYFWTSNVDHGTQVATIIAGDYTQNQASSWSVCDPAGAPHTNTWEKRHSGMAKEAIVDFYDHKGTSSLSPHVESTSCAQGIGTGCSLADVINTSNAWSSNSCNPSSSSSLEDAYEHAYDDGILVVAAAGNYGSSSGCNMGSPADTPKVFAVNGVDVTGASYNSSPIEPTFAVTGGADIQSPNGTTRSGALSLVSLTAPSDGIDNVTRGTGNIAGCADGSPSGTSFAAPMVAGMGLVAKGFHLDQGNSWISSAGRLHTFMLLMGDRANGTSGATQTDTKVSKWFGMGRVKMRLMDPSWPTYSPGALHVKSQNFTSTNGDDYYLAFNDVANGADLLKCVSYQQEDMSGKDNISKIDLRVEIRAKVNGLCGLVGGNLYASRTDYSYDLQKMVSFVDSEYNIEDRCIWVHLDNDWRSSSNYVTVHTMCYYGAELDNEP